MACVYPYAVIYLRPSIRGLEIELRLWRAMSDEMEDGMRAVWKDAGTADVAVAVRVAQRESMVAAVSLVGVDIELESEAVARIKLKKAIAG